MDRPQFRSVLASALARAGGLELATPRMTAGIDGRRTGRRSGNALEFSEYREYQAGDDLRRLDWGVFARSEQLMVKLYSEEVDPRCDIVLDDSASMATEEAKAAAALGLAGLLAQAAANAGFSLAVWHARETLEKEPFPYRPLEWSCGAFDGGASPGEAFGRFAGGFQSRGIRIVVTDLLWPEEPGRFLRRLADGAIRAVVIQLLTRDELDPAVSGTVSLTDAETGEERELAADDALLARYRQRLARHQELWSRAAGEYGVRLIRLTVEEFYPGWDLQQLFRCGVLK